MRKFLAVKVLAFHFFACSSLLANGDSNMSQVVVNHGKRFDYYHIKYALTNNNFTLHNPGDKFFFEDGQFEIYLNKQEFPIPSPNCKNNLILRMPSTLSDDKNHRKSIHRKKRLYEEIKKVHEGKLRSLEVVVALNPYVKVKSKNPLSLELENCNIFFRTKKNHYVDTLNQ